MFFAQASRVEREYIGFRAKKTAFLAVSRKTPIYFIVIVETWIAMKYKT